MGLKTFKPVAHNSLQAAHEARATNVEGNVGSGAVVINGNVHGPVSVVHTPAPRQSDMRCVADTLQVLRALDQEQHLSVIVWMERTFGTQMVKGLSADAHRRVRRYAQAVINNAKPQPQRQLPAAAPPVAPQLERMRARMREANARRMALYGEGVGKLS